MELFSASLRDIAEGPCMSREFYSGLYFICFFSRTKCCHICFCTLSSDVFSFGASLRMGASCFLQTLVVHGEVTVVNITAIKSLNLDFFPLPTKKWVSATNKNRCYLTVLVDPSPTELWFFVNEAMVTFFFTFVLHQCWRTE